MSLTKQQQQERVNTLKKLITGCDAVENNIGKGRNTRFCMVAYLCGFYEAMSVPDPCISIAIIRGGDPRTELKASVSQLEAVINSMK